MDDDLARGPDGVHGFLQGGECGEPVEKTRRQALALVAGGPVVIDPDHGRPGGVCLRLVRIRGRGRIPVSH